MESIGPFGLSPDVRLRIRIDKGRRKYIINEAELASNLSCHKIRPEGKLSEFSDITLSDAERRHKHIPYNATEYAFMYPLSDLSSTSDRELASCFGASSHWLPSAAALCFGAFVYLDKNASVLRINALIEDDGYASGFFIFNGPHRLPERAATELGKKGFMQPLTFRTLRASSATQFAWMCPSQFPELAIPHGGFAYQFENPALDRYFTLADQHVLLGSMRDLRKGLRTTPAPEKLPDDLERILQTSAGFAMGYPATNKSGISFSLQNEVPFQLRLTSAFLVALGRSPNDKLSIVKTGKGHYEYKPNEPEPQGLRWVSLSAPLHQIKTPIVWSSKNAEKWLREWYTDPIITDCLKSLSVDNIEEIFGPAECIISPEKLVGYEQSTHIALGVLLPPFFYRALLQLTANKHYIQYFWRTKSFPLADFLKPFPDQDACFGDHPMARNLMVAFLEQVMICPMDYGFKDLKQIGTTLEQSLTELSTAVVISQEGQFLVGNYNQILEPTRESVPILFLATAAIDFDEPDRHPAAEREESRYFTITERGADGSVKGRWRSEEAKQAFKTRLKVMYDMLFTRCAQAGVTHPSFLPIGLGAFLPRVECSSVKSIYHQAQFELLEENDYGFVYYFLNPGPGRKEAEELLGKYTFNTEVVLHTKNGKFLATELARAGFRTCCLNPSDCIAMMSGMMGYWWEVGKGSRYVGEEDIVATSTLVLAARGISTVYESDRISAHKSTSV